MIKPISSNHDPDYKFILTTRHMQTLHFPSQKPLEYLPRSNRKAWRLEQVRVYDNCLPFPSFEGFKKTRDLGLRLASLLECLEACESQNPPLRNLASITVRKSLSSRCNLAYHPKCSLRNIHMASSDKSDSRGALIVLEGLDRCGKTSQCGRLHTYLEETGNAVELWRFPDRNTGVGQMISSYLANESNLDDRAIHLLFSANRWEKRSLMESKLRSGTTLIVDRYSFSGVAFSSAKELDVDWCKAPEVGLLAPDVVVYLDITPEKAAERGGYGGERYEKLEFQKTVAQSYKMLRDSTWQIVDATLPIEDVEKQLRQIVMESVRACQQGKPFSQLWRN